MVLNCVLDKTLESPLDRKENKWVNPKENQPWIFIRKTDAEAETPVLWPCDVKSQLFGKDSDAGKDWRQEKRTTEDEMVGWHHQFNGHEFEQPPRDGEGQGSLACCSPWGCEESDMTWQMNSNTELNHLQIKSSANWNPFQFYCLFYVFHAWFLWLGLVELWVVSEWTPVLFLILKSFQTFTIEYDVSCGLAIYGLYYAEIGFPGSLLVTIHLQYRKRPWFNPWVRKIPWKRDRLPTPVFMGFSGSSDGKDSACSVGDLGSIPGLGRPPGGGPGNLLQYSCLENSHGQRGLEGYSP